jgi:hypothetical protein
MLSPAPRSSNLSASLHFTHQSQYSKYPPTLFCLVWSLEYLVRTKNYELPLNATVYSPNMRRPKYTYIYQYSETNAMNFLFSLLRIKDPYMFRALIAHPKEALYKRHLVYFVRFMSAGCTRIEVPLQSWHKKTRNIRSVVCVASPEDEQVKLETCRGP